MPEPVRDRLTELNDAMCRWHYESDLQAMRIMSGTIKSHQRFGPFRICVMVVQPYPHYLRRRSLAWNPRLHPLSLHRRGTAAHWSMRARSNDAVLQENVFIGKD